MKARTNQAGFSIIEVGLVVVVIIIIGFLGYTFYTNQVNKAATNDQQKTNQLSTASDVKSAPAINSSTDLDTAEATLDETNPGTSGDADQLDAQLNTF